MPSLMCSALYSRRSIRSLRVLQRGRLRWDATGERRQGGVFTCSFLPGALPSDTFNPQAVLIYWFCFPPGHWTSTTGSLLPTPSPHACVASASLLFHAEENFVQKLLFWVCLFFDKEHINSPIYLLFIFFLLLLFKGYLLQHKETTRLCLWLANYFHRRNNTELSVHAITREAGLRSTLQTADSLPYFSLWRALQVRRVLKTLVHLKHMGFSFPEGSSGQVYVALRKLDTQH